MLIFPYLLLIIDDFHEFSLVQDKFCHPKIEKNKKS